MSEVVYKDLEGVVKLIGSVQGEGAKQRCKMLIGKPDGTDVEVTCFTKGKEVNIQVGSDVALKVQETEYQGKKQITVGLGYIKVLMAPKTTLIPTNPIAEEKKEVDWDGKERRMVRMNCLSHATELVKVIGFSDMRDLTEMTTKAKEVAGELEAWVYRW